MANNDTKVDRDGPAISNPEIVEERINLAHRIKAAADRGEELDLPEDEIRVDDALIDTISVGALPSKL